MIEFGVLDGREGVYLLVVEGTCWHVSWEIRWNHVYLANGNTTVELC